MRVLRRPGAVIGRAGEPGHLARSVRSVEPPFLPHLLDLWFLLVTAPFLPFLHPPSVVAASDRVPSVVTMIFSRTDRCIDLNDHGQFRGRDRRKGATGGRG